MTCKEILKLPEGTHVVTIDEVRCMAIRMQDGFTLTRFLPEKKMLIQRYDEQARLIREDTLDNPFAGIDEKEEKHENTDC